MDVKQDFNEVYILISLCPSGPSVNAEDVQVEELDQIVHGLHAVSERQPPSAGEHEEAVKSVRVVLQLDLHLTLQQPVRIHHRLIAKHVILRGYDVGVGHARDVGHEHGAEPGVGDPRVHVAGHRRLGPPGRRRVTLRQVQVGRQAAPAVQVRVQTGHVRVRDVLIGQELGQVARDCACVAQPVGGLFLGGRDSGQEAGVVLVGGRGEVEGLQGRVDQNLGDGAQTPSKKKKKKKKKKKTKQTKTHTRKPTHKGN